VFPATDRQKVLRASPVEEAELVVEEKDYRVFLVALEVEALLDDVAVPVEGVGRCDDVNPPPLFVESFDGAIERSA
jgi:hypothetical protein